MHRRHAGVHDLGTISARSRHDLGRISQVCIVCGETGSGKSTQVRGHAMYCACLHPLNLAGRRLAAPLLSTTYHQVPQMLLERSLSSGRGGSTSIICTQVAAPSVGHPPLAPSLTRHIAPFLYSRVGSPRRHSLGGSRTSGVRVWARAAR